MAITDYAVVVKTHRSTSLESLIEEYADRVPATTNTMAQLNEGTRTFYMQRLKHRVGPPPTELAARCLRNEGMRQMIAILPPADLRHSKRASLEVVRETRATQGRWPTRYRSSAEVVDGSLRVLAGLIKVERVQASAAV